MKRKLSGVIGACLLFIAAAAVSADVQVTTDHNDPDHATAEFKFKDVPSPAKINAATSARFSVIDGDKDDAGGDLEVLHDGKLPSGQDEPSTNFFFNQGTEGGRILIDLGRVISVKEVNTYSWHSDTRAPQVYALYGADGTAAGFNSVPANDVDPATVGWKLMTRVDTRPKAGEGGGQYGVRISDTAGALGKFRYLLIAAKATETDDEFGNTFFSEINVIDSKATTGEMLRAPGGQAAKADVKTVDIDGGKYTATIDTSETPDLTEWADKELAPMVVEWYPKLVKMLPSEGYAAPTHFSITFRAKKKGVADTGGTRINCAADFFRAELKGQSKGAILHEMVHVVQQYGSFRAVHPHADHNPGWLVEGIPDYIRWYDYEPKSGGANISKRGYDKANYDGSYRITANFLDYVVTKYDKNIVQEMNAAMRNGTYSEDLWKKDTGKSITDLNDQWKADLAKKLGIEK
jgi:hypothetical protein